MSRSKVYTDCFRSGLLYKRFGLRPSIFVAFQELLFKNKPLTGLPAFL